MDSLTQIVLGAAVGEVVLGKKVGNKAMFYGAVAGTIPDLDVISSNFTDTASALEFHRGFTHSIVFSVLFAPVFGWLVTRYEQLKDFRAWSLLFFWAFFTHPLLDAHTTWGTQLFWPFDLRLAFKTIFVIDPLYTVPFLVCLIFAMVHNRANPKRQYYNKLGLLISSGYLLLTFILKYLALTQFESALANQNIEYKAMETRPSPLNTILWNANIDTEDAYLLADYSLFDTQPISFTSYPKNHQLPDSLADSPPIRKMQRITNGWYIISEENGLLYFSDLRFGILGFEEKSMDFAFKYRISTGRDGKVKLTEVGKTPRDGKQLIGQLWKRIKGN
jgi:inner membrane protein